MSLRISDWWNSKVAMLVGWSYFFVLLSGMGPKSYLILLPLILIWLFSTAGFGYYINNWFDIEIDRKASKPNSVANHSKLRRFFTSLILASISLGSALFLFWDRPIFVAVVGFQLLLFILYSATPFRWKEVAYLDILTDSLYAQVIPLSIMALVVFTNQTASIEVVHVVIFCFVGCWAFISGLRNILEHQVLDFQNDRVSGVSNTTQQYGVSVIADFLKKRLIPLEWLFFCIIIISVGFQVPTLLILTTVFVLVLGFTTPIAEGVIEKTKPFRLGSRLLEPRLIYEFWFPLSCLMVLSYTDWKYSILIFVHLVLFRNWILVLAGDFMGNVVYYQTSDVLWHRGALRFYYDMKTVFGLVYNLSKDITNRVLTTLWAILVGFLYRLVHIVYFKGILELWIGLRLLVNYLAYQFKYRVLGDKQEHIRWKNRNGRND